MTLSVGFAEISIHFLNQRAVFSGRYAVDCRTFRRQRLRQSSRLLELQKESQILLITSEEISGIQWIWYHDFHDAPSVTKIYEEVYGEELVMNKKINERRAREHALLEEICQEQGVSVELVENYYKSKKTKAV